MAAMSGNLAMARLLLDRGANPNSSVKSSFVVAAFRDDTPLSMATYCGHSEMVELLLRRGADPNRVLQDHFVALHLAETAAIAELLLAHGAKLEMRGYEYRTPLHQAAMRNRIDVVKCLLAHGANIEARDELGRTPLLISLDQPTLSREMTDLFIQHGARVNVRSSNGEAAIHLAARGDMEVSRMLLDAGADINAPDRWQRTPLHLAVQANNAVLVDFLLAHHANVNAHDYAGQTPLYYILGGSNADHQIAAALREHGGK